MELLPDLIREDQVFDHGANAVDAVIVNAVIPKQEVHLVREYFALADAPAPDKGITEDKDVMGGFVPLGFQVLLLSETGGIQYHHHVEVRALEPGGVIFPAPPAEHGIILVKGLQR